MRPTGVFGEEGNTDWAERHYGTLNVKCPGFFIEGFHNVLAWSIFISCHLLSEDRYKRCLGLVLELRVHSAVVTFALHYLQERHHIIGTSF